MLQLRDTVMEQAEALASTPVERLSALNELRVSNYSGTNCDVILSYLDRVLAFIALVIVSPVMGVIAVLIRLDSSGPAIFTQQRIARLSGRTVHANDESRWEEESELTTFTIYKFRTYYENGSQLAPKRSAFDFGGEQIDHVRLQLKDDPRITRVGRFLRRTSLDELPNFFNVLLGDMRIVGPRPEVSEMYHYYSDEQKYKFSVKPGITGLAQINGRGKLEFKQTVDYDLMYVKNRSFRLDLRILLRTFRVVITGDGSY